MEVCRCQALSCHPPQVVPWQSTCRAIAQTRWQQHLRRRDRRHRAIEKRAQTSDDNGPLVLPRRSLLPAALLSTAVFLLSGQQVVQPFVTPSAASAARKSLQQDPWLAPLQQFWQQLVSELQQQLSDDFSPSLVFYGPAEMLPSGAPGDPALEYNKNKARSCGSFTPGFSQPYAVCPLTPGGLPADDTARDCCRHLAYCVPRSRYAFAALDRQSSVVASPRLALAEPSTWQGVLVHEMGHCIDFHVFPGRYNLPPQQLPRSAAAAVRLADINAQASDVEVRADRMANALLQPMLGGQHLCYSSSTHVQALVPESVGCVSEDAVSSRKSGVASINYIEHYPHPPVSK